MKLLAWIRGEIRHSTLVAVGLLVACGLAVQIPLVVRAQTAKQELDRVRREPIIDGRAAGGVQLGDTMVVVTKKLGGLPEKVEEFEEGRRRDFLYVWTDGQAQWALGVVFREDVVTAIWIVASRRPPQPYPYQGRTNRGYQIGDPTERLRALYGAPDAVIADLGLQTFWWYRAAGLLISPGERIVRGDAESSLIVLDPRATVQDVRRLLHLPPEQGQ